MKPLLHETWYELLDAARQAGLARDLTCRDLYGLLGVDAARPAEPELFAEILHEHYRAGGDPAQMLEMRRRDGYAAVRLGEPMNAMRWLARLIGAAPTLSGVTVQRRPFVSLRRGGRLARVYSERGWAELADVVDAANALLGTRTWERFVPLRMTLDTEAYVLANADQARILAHHGLLECDWVHAFEGRMARAA